MSSPLPPFGIRIPSELKRSLDASAKKENRSLSAEIITRLQQTLIKDRQLSALDEDDPLANIFLSAEAISTALNVIMKSVLLSKVETGDIIVAESMVSYDSGDRNKPVPDEYAKSIKVLNEEELRLIEKIRDMSDEEKKGVYRLLGIEPAPANNP